MLCRIAHGNARNPCVQLFKQFLPGTRHTGRAHRQGIPPGHEGGGNSMQGPGLVVRHGRRDRPGVALQQCFVRGGKHHALPVPIVLRQGPRLMLRHNHMGVHAAEAKGTDAAAPGPLLRGQRLKHLRHAHGRGLKINVRIGPLKMRLRRHKAFFKAEHGLGKADSASGGIQMPQIALD